MQKQTEKDYYAWKLVRSTMPIALLIPIILITILWFYNRPRMNTEGFAEDVLFHVVLSLLLVLVLLLIRKGIPEKYELARNRMYLLAGALPPTGTIFGIGMILAAHVKIKNFEKQV